MNATRYLLYGCGQLGMMGLARFFFQWLLHFADKGGGAGPDGAAVALFSATAAGSLLLAFRLFDGVTDPVAGVLSDAWVRRGRERQSLLWVSFLLPPIGLALVFSPSAGMAPEVRWTLLTAGMFLFFVGYTFYAIPYWSLVDDYSEGDGNVRRALSNLLGAALMVATLVGFVVSPKLVERHGHLTAALAFAAPAALLMILPIFARPPGVVPVEPSDDPQPLLAGLLDAFRHRRFLAVLVIFCGSQMSFTVMTSGAVYIVTDLLDRPEGDLAMILGPFLLVALVSFLGVPWIGRRLGWQRAVVVASIGLGVVYAGTAGLGRGIIGSPLTTAAILFGLGGPMAAVLLGLEGEAITACAREREGEVTSVYFGVFNLLVKGLNGVAIVITGMLIDQSKGEWGTTAVRGISLVAGALLVLGVLGYFALRPRRRDAEAP